MLKQMESRAQDDGVEVKGRALTKKAAGLPTPPSATMGRASSSMMTRLEVLTPAGDRGDGEFWVLVRLFCRVVLLGCFVEVAWRSWEVG